MELMTRRETWHINYRHALGATASHFFANIRDNAKLDGRSVRPIGPRAGATAFVLRSRR